MGHFTKRTGPSGNPLAPVFIHHEGKKKEVAKKMKVDKFGGSTGGGFRSGQCVNCGKHTKGGKCGSCDKK